MIEVTALTKRFGTITALHDVSFRVGRGEIVGLLGPNGAGKSTMMRVLTGYLPPSEGTARVAGHDVQEEPIEARRHIGYLPETVPVYGELTVRDYLRFIADLRELPRAGVADRIGRVMEQTGVAHVAHRVIGHLSKGYRQRVGLAQALIHDPDLLILDEPTVGLDPTQVVEIRSVIKELARGHTVVLSSHILPEVSAICSRIIVIAGGRIVAEDTQANLEKRLKGAERITAVLKGPQADIEAAVRGLPGVRAVTTAPGADGTVEVKVETELGRDIREELSLLAGTRRWPLLALAQDTMSLESMFIQLTGGGGGA